MERKPFKQLSNDLFFRLKCTCPDPKYAESNIAHLMKREILFTGYNDANFFDAVNSEPAFGACNCGRKYSIQWFRDGVEAAWVDEGGLVKPEDEWKESLG
jgi:hypothetical protein